MLVTRVLVSAICCRAGVGAWECDDGGGPGGGIAVRAPELVSVEDIKDDSNPPLGVESRSYLRVLCDAISFRLWTAVSSARTRAFTL